jgi:hypothetical protein
LVSQPPATPSAIPSPRTFAGPWFLGGSGTQPDPPVAHHRRPCDGATWVRNVYGGLPTLSVQLLDL